MTGNSDCFTGFYDTIVLFWGLCEDEWGEGRDEWISEGEVKDVKEIRGKKLMN